MHSATMIRTVLIAAALVYAHVALSSEGYDYADKMLEPGTEVFSVLDSEVRSFTYNTAVMTVEARRQKTGDRFTVNVTYSDGREKQNCTASPDLNGLLHVFTSLIVKAPLGTGETGEIYPDILGSVEIKDNMVFEPMPPVIYRTDSEGSKVAAVYEGMSFEIEMKVEPFQKLNDGCDELK